MASENQPAASASTGAGASAGFLMIGAVVIVGGHILFSIIMNEFGFSSIFVALAALVLLSILGIAGIKVSNSAHKVIGYFMGLAAVFLLLGDLRGSFPDGVVDNIANLTFYAGCVLMFLGARGLKD